MQQWQDDGLHRHTGHAFVAAVVLVNLVLGGMLAFALPPLWLPDEPSHYSRSLALLAGRSLPDAEACPEQSAWPGPAAEEAFLSHWRLRRNTYNGSNPYSMAEVVASPAMPAADRACLRLGNVAVAPPYLHLPQALGALAARLFGGGPAAEHYAGRLFNLATSTLLSALALLWAPAGWRPILALLSLLPAVLILRASLSYDGVILGLSLLAGALVARPLARPAVKPDRLRVLAATLAALAASKLAYLPLLLLALAVPRRCFATAGHRWAWVGLTTVPTLVLALAWYSFVAGLHSPGMGGDADAAGKLSILVANPFYFIDLVVRTLFDQAGTYVAQALVSPMGWSIATTQGWSATLGVVLVVAVTAGPAVPAQARIMALAGVGAAALAVFAAVWLAWSPAGAGLIEGVQGRYALPLLPFLALAAAFPARRPRSLALLAPGMIVVPLVACAMILAELAHSVWAG